MSGSTKATAGKAGKRPARPRKGKKAAPEAPNEVRSEAPPSPRRTARPVGRPRSDGKPHLTRERVFSVSTRIISAHGYAGASIRMIAAALDASPASLFHLFRSKDEMLNELIAWAAAPSLAFYARLDSAGAPPAVALYKSLVEEVTAVASVDRDYPALFYLPELQRPEFAAAQRVRAAMVVHYRRLIEAGCKAGVLRAEAPALAAEQAFQLTETSILAGRAARDIAVAAQAKATARLFLRALLKAPATLSTIEAAAGRIALRVELPEFEEA